MSRRRGQCGCVVRKGPSWFVRFWEDVPGQDRRVQRSVRICPVSGPGSLRTKSERERRAKEIIAESGVDSEKHFQQVQAVNLGTTFRNQSEAWLRQVQKRKRNPVKPRTISNWNSHLKWINPHLGDVPLCSVNNLELKELVEKMAQAGLSPKTMSNYVQVVKMVVASAINENGEALYPRSWNHELVDLPVVEKADQRTPTFTEQEVVQIIQAAQGQYRVLYALLAASGLRIGEALALEIEHFSKDGTIFVRQGLWNGGIQSPKTRNGVRDVDLPSNITDMLAQFLRGRKSGFIFRATSGSPLHQSNVLRRNFHPVLVSAGLERCGFHAFRRFRGTHLTKQGVPDELKRIWLGHGEVTVTDRYVKLKNDVVFRKMMAEKAGAGFETFLPELLNCSPCSPATENVDVRQVTVM